MAPVLAAATGKRLGGRAGAGAGTTTGLGRAGEEGNEEGWESGVVETEPRTKGEHGAGAGSAGVGVPQATPTPIEACNSVFLRMGELALDRTRPSSPAVAAPTPALDSFDSAWDADRAVEPKREEPLLFDGRSLETALDGFARS